MPGRERDVRVVAHVAGSIRSASWRITPSGPRPAAATRAARAPRRRGPGSPGRARSRSRPRRAGSSSSAATSAPSATTSGASSSTSRAPSPTVTSSSSTVRSRPGQRDRRRDRLDSQRPGLDDDLDPVVVARQRPGLRAQQRQPPGPEHPRRDPLPPPQLPPPARPPRPAHDCAPPSKRSVSGRGRGGDRGRLPWTSAGGRGRGTRRACRGPTSATGATSLAQGDRGDRQAVAALGGLADHAVDVGADERREVGLVDRQQVGAGDAGAALARDVVAGGDVDHEDLHVGQRGREDRGQVVAAALDEDDVERPGRGLELLDRLEVGGDVVADRRVRAAAGLDGRDRARPAARPSSAGTRRPRSCRCRW